MNRADLHNRAALFCRTKKDGPALPARDHCCSRLLLIPVPRRCLTDTCCIHQGITASYGPLSSSDPVLSALGKVNLDRSIGALLPPHA